MILHLHSLAKKSSARRKCGAFFLNRHCFSSTTDNHLGGWYGYRSSKAALNMLIKTAAIEYQRKQPGVCIAAIHPGSTQSPLSEPFAKPDKTYSPAITASRLVDEAKQLNGSKTGKFFHWDGSKLLW